jgi:hypothetical protein
MLGRFDAFTRGIGHERVNADVFGVFSVVWQGLHGGSGFLLGDGATVDVALNQAGIKLLLFNSFVKESHVAQY